jgi:hypothetical protein
MLKPLPKNEPQIGGRVLFLICSYGARPAISFATKLRFFWRFGRLADRLTAYSLRQFIASNRDFAANPRTLAYQLGLVKDVLALGRVTETTCFIDPVFSDQPVQNQFASLGKVEIRDPGSVSSRDLQSFDIAIMVYPDALGLGRSGMEAELLRNTRVPLYFVNGRRRIMPLDSAARRALSWRRLLATTRLTELCLSLLIIPLAMFWAALDALRGKS